MIFELLVLDAVIGQKASKGLVNGGFSELVGEWWVHELVGEWWVHELVGEWWVHELVGEWWVHELVGGWYSCLFGLMVAELFAWLNDGWGMKDT